MSQERPGSSQTQKVWEKCRPTCRIVTQVQNSAAGLLTGNYERDLTEAKLLWQSKKQGQPKGKSPHNICFSYDKPFLQLTCKAHATPEGQETLCKTWKNWPVEKNHRKIKTLERHFHSLLDLTETSSGPEYRSASRYTELVEVVGGKKGAVIYFRLYKVCPTSPPLPQITVRHLENKGADLKVARLFWKHAHAVKQPLAVVMSYNKTASTNAGHQMLTKVIKHTKANIYYSSTWENK